MRTTLGYDAVFDTCFYSCELGAAKPFPEFFAAVLATIDAEPSEVLFVDDDAAYVAGAREIGLHAEEWSIAEGDDGLRRILARHGVKPG
jgi:putative hydrolase of the HAD superfamily